MTPHDERPQPTVVEIDGATTAVIHGEVPFADLAAFFDRSFGVLATVLADQQVDVVGPAFARYRLPLSDVAQLEVGFPTAAEVRPDGDVQVGSLPAGRVARVVHTGSFDGLSSSWERLRTWLDEQGLTAGDDIWEVYLTEPSPEMDPTDLRTELNWPVT